MHIANVMAWINLKGNFEGETFYVFECCEALGVNADDVLTFFQELNTDRES